MSTTPVRPPGPPPPATPVPAVPPASAPSPAPGTTSTAVPALSIMTPASASASGTPTSRKVPTMGGISTSYDGTDTPFTGGVPRRDWTGLAVPTNDHVYPMQLRPVNTSAYIKADASLQLKMTPDPKFNKGSNFVQFTQDIVMELQVRGLDSISYLPHPTDPNGVLSVITDHARYTLDEARVLADEFKTKWDSFDKINNFYAKKMLLSSLHPDLQTDVRRKITENDPFPIIWLVMVERIQSTSTNRWALVKKRMESRKITDYSGQNIELLAYDFMEDARELEIVNQYDHHLTKIMLQAFMVAGGDASNPADPFLLQYRQPLVTTYTRLEKALRKIGYEDKPDDYMKKENLTYSDICSEAERLYVYLKNDNRWLPATSVSDATAPSAKYGANLATHPTDSADSILSKLSALLTQVVPGTKPKTGNCHVCGSPDHWANSCPNKTSNPSSSNFRSKGGKGTDKANPSYGAKSSGRYKGASTTPGNNWKTTKTSEVVERNGRRFNWCNHCKSYTTTHTTATHKGPKPGSSPTTTSAPTTTANLASNNRFLIPDPRAYVSKFYKSPPRDKKRKDSKNNEASYPNLSSFVFWFQQFLWFFNNILVTFLNSPFLLSVASLVNVALILNLHVTMTYTIPPFRILIMPIFWTLLGVASVFGHHAFEKAKIPRAFRRAHRSTGKRIQQRIFKYPRQYRKHLRDAGLCFKRAPTAHERDIHCQSVKVFNHAYDVRRQAERSGKRVRSHLQKPYLPRYRPVPGSFGRGNCSFTAKQKAALLKIINTTFLRAITDEIPSLPTYVYTATKTNKKHKKPKMKTIQNNSSNIYDLIWDSGASLSITHDPNDFEGPIQVSPSGTYLSGISNGLAIQGQGTVAWHFVDASDRIQTLRLPAFYVPKCNERLLSIASVSQVYPSAIISMHNQGATMTLDLNGNSIAIPARINPSNNLPTSTNCMLFPPSTPTCHDCHTFANIPSVAALSSVSPANYNLSEAEKELLRWHFRLGHISMRRIQFLMKTGVLATSESLRRLQSKSAALTTLPRCTACQFGKQRRTPAPGKLSTVIKDKAGAIKKDNLLPGQEVSVDHFKCSTKGRLFTSRGKTSESEMYTGGAIFIDHASNYVQVQFQVQPTTHETIRSKQAFELHCRDYGVLIQKYISDNGTAFTSLDFTKELSSFNQTIRFAGVGAHHHNGHVERAIGTIMSISRTMLLHAAIHWPQVSDPQLWPMAVQYAVFLWNHMPNELTGLSPSDIFTRTRWPTRKFHDLHVFGCPAYVLDKSLADGHKIPKWKPRSRRSIFMGLSPQHASTVPLVLNFDTGAITPQYHVVLDNWFATIATEVDDLPDFTSDAWASLFGESVFQFVSDDDPAPDDLTDPTDVASSDTSKTLIDIALPPPVPLDVPRSTPRAPPSVPPSNFSVPSSTPVPPSPPPLPWSSPLATLPTSTPASGPLHLDSPRPFPTLSSPNQRESTPNQREKTPINSPSPVKAESTSSSTPQPSATKPPKTQTPVPDESNFILVEPRRSNRTIKAPTRFGYDGDMLAGYQATTLPTYTEANMATFEVFGSPVACKAAKSDPDTLNWEEAMSNPDEKEKWLAAAKKEIDELEANGTWTTVPASEATTRILPTLWVFRRKRTPDGEIKKYKGRFTVRGDLQEKTPDDEDSYSPVAQWSSIRMMLVMSLILGWYTCSIDFANAFVQAYLKKPIWIHMPRGFKSSEETKDGTKTCLRLIKSLYGVSIAPRAWYDHVCAALFAIGFVKSEYDNCVFYRPGLMLAQWVDDFCCVYETQEHMDKFVSDLREHGLNLTVEGTLAEFLGIKLERQHNNSFKLTQRGLIEKVLKAAEMSDCNPNSTPASPQPLGMDPDGAPFNEKWKYSSIVGMLIYLSTNTRMDIGFAVSQVARFNHSPKQSHATAVKMILRYLKGTIDQGTILTPTGSLTFDLHCDGDFAGLYRYDPDTEPSSAKSRIGYVILLSGCPLVWKSQLLQSVALSTTEVEYAALSISLRTFIPLKYILQEMVSKLNFTTATTITSRVFEDNAAAFLLATIQRLTSRTRYYHAQYHWFWQHYRDGLFTIERIPTQDMLADGFTKAHPKQTFIHHRKKLQGW